MHPTGNQTHNLGMCPDQESNLQPFGVQHNQPESLSQGNSEVLKGMLPLLLYNF